MPYIIEVHLPGFQGQYRTLILDHQALMDMSPDTMRMMLGLMNKRGEEAKKMKAMVISH